MIYSMDRRELKTLFGREPVTRFTGAESVMAIFRTDEAVVKKILPKPLEPYREPLAMAFVARYPETNMLLPYSEGALFLLATHKGEAGVYCLSMPVTDDMAMVGGREHLGFPKKMAEEITLAKDGTRVEGRVVRKGAEILRITGELSEPAEFSYLTRFSPAATDLEGGRCAKVTSFLYKYSPRPDNKGFDYVPRLIRQVTLCTPREGVLKGSGEVMLRSSSYDPLGEVPAGEVVWITYGVWDNVMLLGKVVARAWNFPAFMPRAMWKSDYFYYIPGEGSTSFARGERRALLKKAKTY